MSHATHTAHPHVHGPGCGHVAVAHGDHVDYAHDGHLHHAHEGHVDECVIPVEKEHPDVCTGGHACDGHGPDHVHGSSCGHPAIPHGSHVGYLVNGHLHHPHDGHCDMHGLLATV